MATINVFSGGPYLVDVKVSREASEKSKLPSVILQGIASEIAKDPDPTRPKPNGKKWQELVWWGGSRYAANCRWLDGKIVIGFARKAAQKKVRVARA